VKSLRERFDEQQEGGGSGSSSAQRQEAALEMLRETVALASGLFMLPIEIGFLPPPVLIPHPTSLAAPSSSSVTPLQPLPQPAPLPPPPPTSSFSSSGDPEAWRSLIFPPTSPHY
jgi:hypothetical protein